MKKNRATTRLIETDLRRLIRGLLREADLSGKSSALVGELVKINRALEAAGAARMIEEKDLTGESLAREVTALVDEPARIGAMEEAARKLGRPAAAVD